MDAEAIDLESSGTAQLFCLGGESSKILVPFENSLCTWSFVSS
jgi:hypothetical protein